MNDRPSRGHAHQTRPRSTTNESDARMRDSSVVSLSLSLSFALKKSQDDEENIDAKKIDIHGDISKYLSNSKRSHRKGEFPRKLSHHHHISRPHHSRPQSRRKKTYLHRRRRNLRASERRRSLRGRRRRANRRERLDGERGGQHLYMCMYMFCTNAFLNEEFILFRSGVASMRGRSFFGFTTQS